MGSISLREDRKLTGGKNKAFGIKVPGEMAGSFPVEVIKLPGGKGANL